MKNTVYGVKPSAIKKTDNINPSHRKDSGFTHGWYIIDKKTGFKLLDMRIYWPGVVCFCCAWLRVDGLYMSASAKASGYGYCKHSAAVGSALSKLIQYEHSIDGVGTGAIHDLLVAMQESLYKDLDTMIVEAHP